MTAWLTKYMLIYSYIFFCSIYNTTKNYARWQLLYSEYSKYAAFLNDGIKDILKTEFLLAQTTSQGCVRVVESSMPLAVTRPFVEEFITKEDIDKVYMGDFGGVNIGRWAICTK